MPNNLNVVCKLDHQCIFGSFYVAYIYFQCLFRCHKNQPHRLSVIMCSAMHPNASQKKELSRDCVLLVYTDSHHDRFHCVLTIAGRSLIKHWYQIAVRI